MMLYNSWSLRFSLRATADSMKQQETFSVFMFSLMSLKNSGSFARWIATHSEAIWIAIVSLSFSDCFIEFRIIMCNFLGIMRLITFCSLNWSFPFPSSFPLVVVVVVVFVLVCCSSCSLSSSSRRRIMRMAR